MEQAGYDPRTHTQDGKALADIYGGASGRFDLPTRQPSHAPADSKPVLAELELQRKLVDELDSALGALTERIGPALSNVPTALHTGEAAGLSRPSTCQIGSGINDVSQRIAALTARVRSLWERVEL